MTDKLEIAINKARTLQLTVGCLVFVIMSVWLWTVADKQTRRSPVLIKTVSVLGVSFFGLGLVLGPKILFTKRPGLIIDNQGILNNTSVGKESFIAWKNVDGFKIITTGKIDTVLIYINNAEESIRNESIWKQKIMRYCLKKYGTPISIGVSTLKIDANSLIGVLSERHLSFKHSC